MNTEMGDIENFFFFFKCKIFISVVTSKIFKNQNDDVISSFDIY